MPVSVVKNTDFIRREIEVEKFVDTARMSNDHNIGEIHLLNY